MRFLTEAGGRRHTIEVRASASGWTVSIDGGERQVSLVRAGSRWSMLVGGAGEGAPVRSHEVAFERGGRGRHLVHVDGRVVAVTLGDPTRTGLAAPAEVAAAAGGAVSSPMAGRVVKILVREGDRVEAGQGLVVVESMKMENELRARRAGRVVEVRVQERQPVEAHAPLVVIGPDEDP